ncbi:MAG: hypothetical protein WBD97_05320, partial [Pseudolabrys sp.]
MSALGASRSPRLADKTGTIVGRSIYVNCARVLLDGSKSPISVHCDYLDAILPVDAAMKRQDQDSGPDRRCVGSTVP